MTHRFLAMLLVMAMLGVCSPASAADLVSPKLLPPASGSRVVTPNLNAALDSGTVPSDPPPERHRHWSKTGKILTIVGGGLIGAGAGAFVYGQNNPQAGCRSGGIIDSCTAVVWKATGGIWMGAGAALVIVGLTRHTTD